MFERQLTVGQSDVSKMRFEPELNDAEIINNRQFHAKPAVHLELPSSSLANPRFSSHDPRHISHPNIHRSC